MPSRFIRGSEVQNYSELSGNAQNSHQHKCLDCPAVLTSSNAQRCHACAHERNRKRVAASAARSDRKKFIKTLRRRMDLFEAEGMDVVGLKLVELRRLLSEIEKE